MVRSRLQSAAVALILGCALIASQRSFAVCFVDAATRASSDPNAPTWPPSYTAAPSYGARLNNEGLTERVADIVVMDDGTLPNCFSLGNVITFLYNAVLRLPASVTSPSTNVDRVDSAGTAGLRVSAASTTDGQLHTTTVVITVTQAGTRRNALTGAGSALRLKNLRFGAIALAAG